MASFSFCILVIKLLIYYQELKCQHTMDVGLYTLYLLGVCVIIVLNV